MVLSKWRICETIQLQRNYYDGNVWLEVGPRIWKVNSIPLSNFVCYNFFLCKLESHYISWLVFGICNQYPIGTHILLIMLKMGHLQLLQNWNFMQTTLPLSFTSPFCNFFRPILQRLNFYMTSHKTLGKLEQLHLQQWM